MNRLEDTRQSGTCLTEGRRSGVTTPYGADGGAYSPAAGGVEEFMCVGCRTAEHVDVEEIQPPQSGLPGFVLAEYSCGRCERFYAHEVPVPSLGAFLDGTAATAGILRFGRHYMHCGEPMTEQEMRLYTLTASGTKAEGIADVVLPGLVLKCMCGFQMSVPH